MRKRVPDTILNEIKELYEIEHWTRRQISEKFKLSKSATRYYIEKLKLTRKFNNDWVKIPNNENYMLNLKDNRIVEIGYGEIKSHLNEGSYDIKLNRRTYKLHRIVFLCHHGYYPKYINHIDNDKTNNDINNLQEFTKTQCAMNSNLNKNNSSGYKGVYFSKLVNKYKAQFQINGKSQSLGYFNDPVEAARAYDEMAIKHFGEFARTNKKMGLIK